MFTKFKVQQAIGITITAATTVAVYTTIRNRITLKKLKSKSKQKLQELNEPQSLLLKHKNIVSDELKSKILSLSATQIRDEIIAGNVKCIEVIITYCLQCDKVNKKVNALFEKHYNSAIIDAQKLDNKLLELKRKSLHEFKEFVSNKHLLGIPISIKDVFEMKDSDSTNGILYWCDKKCKSDGSVLSVIRENGGIPFCKTSVPQLLMMPETWNNIIGDTVNPHNTSFTCGGSSGGEGALIGGMGSILGVGGDIGGSLRIPAHFNGVMAYKPSSKRTLINGKIWCYKVNASQRDRYTAKCAILPSVGPMARNVDDIVLFLKGFWAPKTFELDVYCAPVPFRENMYLNSDKPHLNIGYWINDGWFTATNVVKRAINLCVDGLKTHYKYKLIPMDFNDGPKILQMYFKYMFPEGNMTKYINALQGEPLHPQYMKGKYYKSIPDIIKTCILHPVLSYFGEKRKVFISKIATSATVKQLEDKMYEIMEFKYEFWQWVDKYDNDKIDVLLTPVSYFPALPIGCSRHLGVATSLTPTLLQNILDCSAGSIGPITFVKEEECKYDTHLLPMEQRDSMSRELNEFMKDAKGLPVNVQVFGRPFDDEIVLRVMKELEGLFVKKK